MPLAHFRGKQVQRAECADDCLHCAINELIGERLEGGTVVDVTDLTAKITESLADLIIASVEERDRANLIAHTLQHLGAYLLLKSGAMQAEH